MPRSDFGFGFAARLRRARPRRRRQAPAAADCPAGAPTGLFKGTATEAGASGIEVDPEPGLRRRPLCRPVLHLAVRLRLDRGDAARRARLSLNFDARGGVGHADLKLDGDTLTGRLAGGRGQRDCQPAAGRAGPGARRADARRSTLTTAQWREDLEAFATELPKRHANAFFHTAQGPLRRRDRQPRPAAGPARQRRDLRRPGADRQRHRRRPHLHRPSPPTAALCRSRSPASAADGRPELRIVAAGPGLERALGARVVRIGATAVAEAWRRALHAHPAGRAAGAAGGPRGQPI